jgi:hypothetical protein
MEKIFGMSLKSLIIRQNLKKPEFETQKNLKKPEFRFSILRIHPVKYICIYSQCLGVPNSRIGTVLYAAVDSNLETALGGTG